MAIANRTRLGILSCAALAWAGGVGAFEVRQVLRPARYSRGDENVRVVQPADKADWIWMPGHEVFGVAAYGDAWKERATAGKVPGWFFRFRNDFDSDGSSIRIDVTADERFALLLDGKLIAQGPLRGMVDHWYYQSYEIADLAPGRHRLEAVCWQLLTAAPVAQLSYRGGFLLKAEGRYDEALSTGKGVWRVAPLVNTVMSDRGTSGSFGAGNQCRVTGTGLLNEEPAEGAWRQAVVVRAGVTDDRWWERTPGWMLFPADRPDQTYEVKTPGRVVNDDHDLAKPFVVPAHAELDLFWDLDDYYCAYPELETSGGKGAVVTWGWTESLRDGKGTKGNRDEWRGKSFSHVFADTFVSDGRDNAAFTTPWWRCGRWCRLTVRTAEEPIRVKKVAIGESRYPLDVGATFECSEPSVDEMVRISRRTMESCMHEMLFDCPYYEQQMYPGDTRIQLQILNALTADARMARFAMSVYDWSRRDNGMVAMNFPSRALQESCTYTMCWIMMFRDHLMWRNDLSFLRERMPGVRNALVGLAKYENAEGLLENLPGWCFVDWVKDWAKENPDFPTGCAPGGEPGKGVSALNNLMYLMAVQSAAAVDLAIGEGEFSAVWERKAKRLQDVLLARFWVEGRGLLSDTDAKDCFCEHAQALGILTGVLTGNRRDRALEALVERRGLAPVSSYFSYYLFEALAQCGRGDVVMERFKTWSDYLAWGARTTFETQHRDSRSDCHAWSASPLYFLQSSVAGVRPAQACFRTVRIAPQPGRLSWMRVKTPTPRGLIMSDLAFKECECRGRIVLPGDMVGTYVWNGVEIPLCSGTNEVKQITTK